METFRDPQAVTEHLNAIAPLSDRITAVSELEDGGTWVLDFDNGTVALVEWAGEPGRIVLSAPLGTPLPARYTEVLETALSYTALWRESGGVKLAKGGEDGELMLILELHSDLGGSPELLTALESFSDLAASWKRYISDHGSTDAARPVGFGGPHMLA